MRSTAHFLDDFMLRPLLLVLVGIILFKFKIGPVVLSLGDGHGVHLGDSLAAFPALVAVLPHSRLGLDRRLGLVRPVSPNPLRRAEERGTKVGAGSTS